MTHSFDLCVDLRCGISLTRNSRITSPENKSYDKIAMLESIGISRGPREIVFAQRFDAFLSIRIAIAGTSRGGF